MLDYLTVLDEDHGGAGSGYSGVSAQKAEAIAVFPSTIKGGFVLSAHRGKGIISVRDPESGTWSAPAFLTITGGSIGAQIGAQAVDLVLVVQNRRGLEQLVRNQFRNGGDAAVSAGPVGRDVSAATDIQLRAQILSYSRSRGLFAGITLNGSTIRQDRDSNAKLPTANPESHPLDRPRQSSHPPGQGGRGRPLVEEPGQGHQPVGSRRPRQTRGKCYDSCP